MLRHAVFLSLLGALALPAAAFARGGSAKNSIGSFVSGERPLYLEIDQFADGATFNVSFMNVPAGSTDQTLYISDHFLVAKHSDTTCPGNMGPDLLYAQTIKVDANSYSGTVTAGKWKETVFIQGYVKTPAGGRLTSMVECHPNEALTSPPNISVSFPLPVDTQQVVRPGRKGFDLVQQPVRLGVPLPKGAVFEKSGVPQLTIIGGPKEGQFSTLAKWSDGSCKWVLAEYRADVTASQVNQNVSVDKGIGNFGGASLASTSGSVTTVDTGAVKFTIDAGKDDLFQSLQSGGRDLISPSAGNKPHFWDDNDVEWTWHKTKVTTRRNGPVRSEIEVEGSFTRSTSATDADRVYVRFYLEAFKGQSALRATVSLRDTSIDFPQHLLFRGFTYRAQLNEAGPFDVRMPVPAVSGDSTQLATGSIGASQDGSFMSAYVQRKDYHLQTDANSSSYKGFIQRNGNDNFAIEGVSQRIGSNYLTGSSSTNYFTAQDTFCDPAFVEMNSAASGRGVVFGLEHACRTWPAAMDVGGDGRIEIGILPRKQKGDTHNYPLTYASAETRSFYLAFESTRAVDPFVVAGSFDYPVAARAELWVYNQSDVWPWKLVTPTEVHDYQDFAEIRTTKPDTSDTVRTVYRFAGGTGGGNNNWEETRRFYDWLRTGNGASYFNSLFEAYYKVDKMAWSIDDGALVDRKAIVNSSAPVTRKCDTYDGSKHTYFQAVPDWAFTRGETHLLDAGPALAATILDKKISPNVQPNGNFVPGTFGAVTSAAMAVLALGPNQPLEDWVHLILDQWTNVVFQQSNSFGVNTNTLGWQAPVGTPEGSASNPDGYMITWSAGKASDKAVYGYMAQQWTDLRLNALVNRQLAHYLNEKAPTDPLIDSMLARAPDMYHFAHRGMPDDHNRNTGEYYILDVFANDANKSAANPLSGPGLTIGTPNPSGYANQSIVNLLLDFRASESAYSYGVELNRSMSECTYQHMASDPVLNDFIYRYLVHYGVIQP